VALPATRFAITFLIYIAISGLARKKVNYEWHESQFQSTIFACLEIHAGKKFSKSRFLSLKNYRKSISFSNLAAIYVQSYNAITIVTRRENGKEFNSSACATILKFNLVVYDDPSACANIKFTRETTPGENKVDDRAFPRRFVDRRRVLPRCSITKS